MKKKSAEQLIAEGRTLRLTHEETAAIKASLLSVIETYPFSSTGEGDAVFVVHRHPFFSWIPQLFLQPIPAMVGIFLVFGAFSGSLVYASRGALPGEWLYPVKVAVIEEVPVILSFSYESKAKWEALRAERRLAEAEALAVSGMLDSETAKSIADDFSRHVARIDRWHIEADESHNELAENMQTLLVRLEAIAEVRPVLANTDIDPQFAAEAMRDTARVSIDALRARLFEGGDISTGDARLIRIRLNAAERAFREGDFQLESDAPGQAYILYQEAKLIVDRASAAVD